MLLTSRNQTILTPLVPSQPTLCQQGYCERVPCFRVEVHDPPGTIVDGKTVDVCADHLGATVCDLTAWANTEAKLSGGNIQVCVIDSRPSLASSLPQSALLPVSWHFASIPLN
jgi:hypothetical protein